MKLQTSEQSIAAVTMLSLYLEDLAVAANLHPDVSLCLQAMFVRPHGCVSPQMTKRELNTSYMF